jgi:type I restriction enzyme S subunit
MFGLINGCAFKPTDWKQSGTPIIRIQNLNDPIASFNYSVAPVAEKNRIEAGDLLFAWSGTLGSSFGARVWSGPSGVLNQHIFKVHMDQQKITLPFSLLVFARVEEDIAKQTHGFKASFVHVKKSDLVKVNLPLPPLPEQRAIATALSDVDALIASLDNLIDKKRDMKQAAMQELLTGKRRLPGFSGEWEVRRLGEIGTFLKGSGVKKDETRSGNLPCIRYGEIYTHHNDYVKSYNSWISPVVSVTATRLKQGDLLFAGSGETKEEIGKCVAFVDDCEAYAGGDIVILRPVNADPMFMGYYCNTVSINTQKASMGQGDAVVHISSSALSRVSVCLPSHHEQTAIAAILSDTDTEIAALEQKRDKTRLLKQGMMQELLTGRIRLV